MASLAAMEVDRDTVVNGEPMVVFTSYALAQQPAAIVVVKSEPAETVYWTPYTTHTSVSDRDVMQLSYSTSGQDDDVALPSTDQQGTGEQEVQSAVEEKPDFGSGLVVMQGEDFWVEVDPEYEESEDAVDVKVEVKEEEEEEESGEPEVYVDTADTTDAAAQSHSSYPGSACLALGSEVAPGVRERCESGERGVGTVNSHWRYPSDKNSSSPSFTPALSHKPALAHCNPDTPVVEKLPNGSAFIHFKIGRSYPSRPPRRAMPEAVKKKIISVEGSKTDSSSAETSSDSAVFGQEGLVNRSLDNTYRWDNEFPCPECGKGFTQNYLKIHVATVHRGEKSFACPECGKKFGQKSHLKTHVKSVHQDSRKYPCPECDKKFCERSNLKRHFQNIHLGARRHPCAECDKDFSQMSTLRTHVETVHKGQKNCPCPECGRRFTKMSDVKTHVETVHLGTRKHACCECDKKFSQRSNLRTHFATVHRQEKKHVCAECGKSFGLKGTLQRHVDTVHNQVKKHACRECKKKFGRRADMYRHRLMVHGVQDDIEDEEEDDEGEEEEYFSTESSD